ncbi:MAG: response regulator transcription factor [Chitinophagaceae bacterium]
MKILIVDDQDIIRRSVTVNLEFLFPDAEFVECRSGLESLEKVGNFKPDIIFMDISMPGMSGMQATREILSEYPGQRIIAFSMNDNIEMVHIMLKAGASGYLLKTDTMDDFQKAVDEVSKGKTFISKNVVSENTDEN